MRQARLGPGQALLVDAMGTLVGLEPPAPRLRRALGQAGIEISLAEAERALRAEIAFYRSEIGRGRGAASLDALRRRCARVLLGSLPGRVAGRLGLEAATELLLASLGFFAFPDALPTLTDLRDRGVKVVVVSNWDASLATTLAEVGLAPAIDAVLTSAQARAAKPRAAIFRRALALAGVEPELALHVGDSLTEDVAGAHAAGIAAVWLNRAGAPVPAGIEAIATLTELIAPPPGGRP